MSLIQWTMLIEPIHLAIPSITVLGYQGNHCTCIWLFGTPRFLAAKCQIQRVSPVLNVEAREFQPKIENYGAPFLRRNRPVFRSTWKQLLMVREHERKGIITVTDKNAFPLDSCLIQDCYLVASFAEIHT